MADQELGFVVCQFLEAVVHEIICLRSLYSKELFAQRRLYDIAVQKSRHPQLNQYIFKAVQSTKEALVNGRLEKVAVLILDSAGFTVERYVVQLSVRPEIFPSLNSEDVEGALRDVLVKLHFANANLKPLPKGCTFEFVAYTYSRRDLPLDSWVERTPESPEGSRLGSPEGDATTILPIKTASVGSGALKVQLFAEVK